MRDCLTDKACGPEYDWCATKTRLLIIALIVSLAAALVACEDSEEELASTTPSATPTSIAPATTTPASSPTAEPTPVPTVPPDWKVYTDPDGRFSLQYPPDWFTGQNSDFYSNDPSMIRDGSGLPPGVIKVEVGFSTAIGSDVCGPVLKTDVATGQPLGLLPGATPTKLGGVEGGRLIRGEGDPALENGLTRIEGVGVVFQGSCVLLVGYFTQQNPDVALFSHILDSFVFQKAPST